MAKPKIDCRRNPKNKQWYTTLKAGNSKKEMTLGEGMHRKFTPEDKARIIKHLSEAEIHYNDGKAKIKKTKKKLVG